VQPEYRKNEMLAFIRAGLDDISISRETFHWGIPFPIHEDGSSSQLPDGSWDPSAGVIYVWFDALINYITGAGFPDDPESFAYWWPADLHVIGKDINRFHTIIWPAMLLSAGIDLPRKVWVHGWLLTRGGERMSKSRGNMLEPADVVAALGPDGCLRAALQRRPRERLRQPREPDRDDGFAISRRSKTGLPSSRRRAARSCLVGDARQGDRRDRSVPPP
jgi:methionyl-tRNA synthetase